jgi:nicotinate phosphoribosyltransferase
LSVLAGAPIDGFGVGTRMNTSADHPYLDCAYKLEEYAGAARRKRSEGKITWPGRKQVFRRLDAEGRIAGDALTVEGDVQPGSPLLECVMRAGRRLGSIQTLEMARQHAGIQLAQLPPALRALDPAAPYPVEVAPALQELARRVDRRKHDVDQPHNDGTQKRTT